MASISTRQHLKTKIKKFLKSMYILMLRRKIIVGEHVTINGRILLSGTKKVRIGNHVYINSNEKSNPIGGSIRCYFKTLRDGEIIIDDGCRISNVAITSLSKVYIGKDVYVGGGG